MEIRTCTLYEIILFSLYITSTKSHFFTYLRNESLDDKICENDKIVFVAVKRNQSSEASCLSMCSDHGSCSSVFVDDITGRCVGCKSEDVALLSTSEGTISFVFKQGTRRSQCNPGTYGGECLANNTCDGTNLECWNNTCICQIGYSYDPKNNNCVENCTEYGSTFQAYLDRRLNGLNDKKFYSVTVETCKSKCIQHDCRSFEYKTQASTCHLSYSTALTNPEAYEQWTEINYYTRNCAE